MKFIPQGTLIILGVLIGLIAAGFVVLLSARPRGEPIQLHPPASPAPLRVHVSGAVNQPGVYTLPEGSITQDAINAAGGPTSQASFASINLASPLRDGQLIILASTDDSTAQPNSISLTPVTSSTAININTATAPELESLPGIGPSLAASIIAFRQEHGPFTEIEDLLAVSGIGPAKLEKIRPFVIVR